MQNELAKRFFFYSAVIDIVKIFGETELGSCEVDEEAVAEYCTSNKFVNDNFECTSKEDLYQKITDDIINGMPVWEFLKVSDWVREILEREIISKRKAEYKKLCKKYKCYTCKYYEQFEASFGTLEKCKYVKPIVTIADRFKSRRDDDFEVKTKCENYEKNLE